jgi:BMFP domain-containing protein YqiC
VREEAQAKIKQRMEQTLKGMDLVTREEFLAMSAMIKRARAEQERLSAELQQLKKTIAGNKGASLRRQTPIKSSQNKKSKKSSGQRKKTVR